jgi:hypothetical protein
MIRNKYIYIKIVKFNDKETIPPAINVPHVFAAFFYIYLTLPNSTHSNR